MHVYEIIMSWGAQFHNHRLFPAMCFIRKLHVAQVLLPLPVHICGV